MNVDTSEISKIQNLIFHEEIHIVEQGLMIIESSTDDPQTTFRIFGLSIHTSKREECWSSDWHEETAFYLHLWLISFLVELHVPWACAISYLYLYMNPQSSKA